MKGLPISRCLTALTGAIVKALKVKETLHLISDDKMHQIDDFAHDWDIEFRKYEYCPIGEIHKRPKDAKIQIVALILSKPTIQPGKKLKWQVVDKTGVVCFLEALPGPVITNDSQANFYFQHRGPSSDYTWDWVLALKPGQRKCLPRMPCVKVKESPFVTIAKAPLRVTGAAIGGTGRVVRTVGKGLSKAGRKLKMGSRVTWVLEADYEDQAKSQASQAETTSDQPAANPATEKNEASWKDDDSVASTTAGSIFDEKKEIA